MSVTNGMTPLLKGIHLDKQTIAPTASDAVSNRIKPGVKSVRLITNVSGVTDFVTLPYLADVEIGDEITIVAGAANCEVRTPAAPSASGEKINNKDCDGTNEYLLAATQIHKFVKIDDTIGWMGHGFTAIGAVAAAIVPDA